LKKLLLAAFVLGSVGCGMQLSIAPGASEVLIAHLGSEEGDVEAFEALANAFVASNPGYDMFYHRGATELAPRRTRQIVFVQSGEATANIGEESSEVSVGDIIMLIEGRKLELSSALDLLCFVTPTAFPAQLPTWIRPDWDPSITDTPGGCATEHGAYRRILLTWLPEKGPYIYHALNAHRVRITDSFTHYHPIEGGFDEFYLVQHANPDSRLLTSNRTKDIENSASIDAATAAGLMEEHPLTTGDLVYMPRGTVHRGLGGVLAQVITTPGFKPGAEIGVDHHLRTINERLSLQGGTALPFNAEASAEAVVK
jgi:mannose-6-phosphate isomerase-like protein (cupin superfamily)